MFNNLFIYFVIFVVCSWIEGIFSSNDFSSCPHLYRPIHRTVVIRKGSFQPPFPFPHSFYLHKAKERQIRFIVLYYWIFLNDSSSTTTKTRHTKNNAQCIYIVLFFIASVAWSRFRTLFHNNNFFLFSSFLSKSWWAKW